MDDHTLVVLSDPNDATLPMLDVLRSETRIVIGDSPDAFRDVADEASVLLHWMFSGKMLRETLPVLPNLRWIHTRTAGLEHVLFPELIESPVPLTNSTGAFSRSLGEWVLAGILFFAKDFRRLIRSQEAGVWDVFAPLEISGKTVGIIGYGDIGKAVAVRAKWMGMRVLGLKRHGAPLYNVDPLVERIYGPDERLEMIAQCDYVVLATPLTKETRGMFGEAEFRAMKPDAVIINVGRGAVVDEDAMIRALSERRIKGAALDVFTKEPLPADSPFYKLDNVLLSPHCADHVPGWIEDSMRLFLSNYERFRKGEPLVNVVDKKLGYVQRSRIPQA